MVYNGIYKALAGMSRDWISESFTFISSAELGIPQGNHKKSRFAGLAFHERDCNMSWFDGRVCHVLVFTGLLSCTFSFP